MENFIYYVSIVFAVLFSTCLMYLFTASIFGISFLANGYGTEISSKNAHKAGAYGAAMFFIVCLLFVFFAPKAKADCDEIYLKVGAGYKFDEQTEIRLQKDNSQIFEIQNSPYSARFETGVECGNLTWGVSHHSQWATGVPFNETGEYYKTEFFIDYKISWGI